MFLDLCDITNGVMACIEIIFKMSIGSLNTHIPDIYRVAQNNVYTL